MNTTMTPKTCPKCKGLGGYPKCPECLNSRTAKEHADEPLPRTDCSPSSTPETDALRAEYLRSNLTETEWQDRLWERLEEMERERDGESGAAERANQLYAALREQVRLTLLENLHLADGDQCTLKRLKDSIGFDLDSPENAGGMAAGADGSPMPSERKA